MAKERPLTERQIEALLAAEDTLYGDVKIPDKIWGRSMRGLRNRGLIEGDAPHVYLTPKGAAAKEEYHAKG